MYRSVSLDLPSDRTDMPPPSGPTSRTLTAATKSQWRVRNGSMFGDAKKVLQSVDSTAALADSDPIEPVKASESTKANADPVEPVKRKVKGVDMRPYKKTCLLDSLSRTVKLIVGSSSSRLPKTFIVHQDMLCTASPFFEAGCKPEWQKGTECVMELPEDNPKYFGSLIYWVYNNDIVYPSQHPTMALEELAQIYLLAEKYQMPRLQNDLIDCMVYETVTNDQWIYPNSLKDIFNNSPPASKLRLFAVNCTLYNWRNFQYRDSKPEEFCADFLFDVFNAFAKNPNAGFKDTFLDSDNQYCELYHIHETEQQGQCTTLKLPEHVCGEL